MSIAAWIGIGVGLVGALAAMFIHYRSSNTRDLGSVSEQWIAQHRAGPLTDQH
jgi:hypothetical protein